jgi:hypothetical protein
MDEIPPEIRDLYLPVMESATVLGSHYAKACGRDTVTAQDIQIGLMYAARNVAGKQVGSLFPEIYEDSDEDEDWEEEEWEEDSDEEEKARLQAEDEAEEVDEDEEPFTRYTGEEELFVKMNECFDTWDEWVPETPLEQSLKTAVERAREAFLVPE